jgi:hypothetical protein
MRATPSSVARQLGKFWGKPEMITIETAPRDWVHFWRSPAVTSIAAERSRGFGRQPARITLTPGRGPEQQRIPLSAWNRSYDPPGRSRPGQRDEPGSADRPERKKKRRYG